MKIAVTITICAQIGIETWRDIHKTQIFDDTATISEIMAWVSTHDKTATFSSLQISDVE